MSLFRPPVSSSLKFCNRSIAYAAPVLWNGLPIPPLNFTYPRLHTPLLYIPLTTEDQTFQAILSRFYFCSTTRPPPPPPVSTVAPRCLLGLTLPYFDPAPKRKVWLLQI